MLLSLEVTNIGNSKEGTQNKKSTGNQHLLRSLACPVQRSFNYCFKNPQASVQLNFILWVIDQRIYVRYPYKYPVPNPSFPFPPLFITPERVPDLYFCAFNTTSRVLLNRLVRRLCNKFFYHFMFCTHMNMLNFNGSFYIRYFEAEQHERVDRSRGSLWSATSGCRLLWDVPIPAWRG